MVRTETFTVYTTSDEETFSNERCAIEHELAVTYPNGLEMYDCDNERLDNSWRSLPYAYFMLVPRNALEWLSLAWSLDGYSVPSDPGQHVWDEDREVWKQVVSFRKKEEDE